MPRNRAFTVTLWALAASATLVGLGLLTRSQTRPSSFGWFAYAPLSETIFVPPVLDPGGIIGAVLLGLGLIALGFLVGLRIGRRQR